jgi:murein DD-endopeptidase MepM/ murein hydrolase activator NlpD
MSPFLSFVLALVAAPGCYAPPLDAPILDPFRAPACAYCPGNRGIEYGPSPGTPVRALAAGRVTFAGPVADTRYVVVLGDDDVRVTYGRLASSPLAVGHRVVPGQLVGTTTDRFLLTFREGSSERYLDPGPHLGVVRRPPHLVPSDQSPPRPGLPGRPVCRR